VSQIPRPPATNILPQYTAAVKTSTLEPTAKALASLNNIVSKDAKLATILHAPTLTQADKSQIVAELEKAAGVPASDKTVKNLLATLAENNRLSILSGVCAKFGEIMSASRGEVEMVVTSATVGLFHSADRATEWETTPGAATLRRARRSILLLVRAMRVVQDGSNREYGDVIESRKLTLRTALGQQDS
jgi:hypothetical protein